MRLSKHLCLTAGLNVMLRTKESTLEITLGVCGHPKPGSYLTTTLNCTLYPYVGMQSLFRKHILSLFVAFKCIITLLLLLEANQDLSSVLLYNRPPGSRIDPFLDPLQIPNPQVIESMGLSHQRTSRQDWKFFPVGSGCFLRHGEASHSLPEPQKACWSLLKCTGSAFQQALAGLLKYGEDTHSLPMHKNASLLNQPETSCI